MLLETTAAKVCYVAGLTVFLTSLGCWAVLGYQESSPVLSTAEAVMKDEAFVRAAARGGLCEIKLGKLAMDQGSNEGVKAFGTRMVAEHTKAGDDFDQAYAQDMVKDHQQDLRDFQREANYGNDDAIREFASATVPMIQQHLDQAKDMLKAVLPASVQRTTGNPSRQRRGH